LHAGEGLDGRSATEKKHGGDDDVSAEPEEKEGEVSGLAPASPNDLEESVGRGRNVLEADGKDTEQENLDGGPGGVPEEQEGLAVRSGHVTREYAT